MTNIRQLVKIALATVTATLLGVFTASGAWAMVPVPDPGRAAPAAPVATVVRTADGGGLGAWQVISISALCALVAVLATVLATRLVQSHGQHPRPAHA